MSDNIQKLPIDLVDDPFTPMRSEISDESIAELAADIKRNGLVQPITVRQKEKRYEVIAGHRRYRAHKVAGLQTIDAVVREVDEREADNIRVRENLFREDINPVDEARYIHYLVERYRYTPDQLSLLLGKSEAYLKARWEILGFPDYLKDALSRGQIGLTAAQWLIKIENENVRREYVRFAILGGITAKRAEAWYRSWHAGNLPRDPEQYESPAENEADEPRLLKMPCILCKADEDINEMAMYYAHPKCYAAIQQ